MKKMDAYNKTLLDTHKGLIDIIHKLENDILAGEDCTKDLENAKQVLKAFEYFLYGTDIIVTTKE